MTTPLTVTAEDLARLRSYIGETTKTDAQLTDITTRTGGVEAAAAELWREKAAGYADLVDTTESGSTRKLSDLHKNALAMASGFEAKIEVLVEAATRRRARTRQIRRA